MGLNLDERDKVVLPLCVIGGIVAGLLIAKYSKTDKFGFVMYALGGGLVGTVVGLNA